MGTAAVVGVGLASQAIGGSQAASAAGKAARAQQKAAARQQKMAIEASKSPQELESLERSLATQDKALARQEKLVEAIDPVTLEASRQALGLLRGEESKALDPIRRQRQRQRKAMIDTLREQLGPGAETSSAGIQALQNFDTQTSEQIEGAQSGALGQLFGIANTGSQGRQLQQVSQGFGNVASGFGARANRQVNAITGTASNIVGTAGAGQVAAGLRGQSLSSFGSSLASAGIGAAGGIESFGDSLGEGFGNLFGGGGGPTPLGQDSASAQSFTGTINPRFGNLA
jgi:hypothetical protein